jgi:recombination protein RecR
MNLPSKLLEEAVDQMSSLPGIGRKTALRLVLKLLRRNKDEVSRFSDAFVKLKNQIKECRNCHNLSDAEICSICADKRRDASLVCVVEDIRDILAIEGTSQFKGVYHVLGGIISPMDGIGPQDLQVESLISRLQSAEVREIVFALSTTMEGETTAFYLYRKLQHFPVKISTIARGVAIGDELQYADEVTLGRSILNRLPFESTLSRS